MPRYSVRAVNAQLVAQGLQDFGGDIPKVGRLQVYRLAQRIYKRLGIEPEPRVGYRRSGRLRRGRKIIKLQNGYAVEYTARNPKGKRRRYARYVRGLPFDESVQATVHRGRWITFKVITEEEVAKLPPEVAAALRDSANRSLGGTRRGI